MSDLPPPDSERAGKSAAAAVVVVKGSSAGGLKEQLAPLFFLRSLLEDLRGCWPLPVPTAVFYDRSLLFGGVELADSEELIASYGDWDAVLAAAGLPPVEAFEAVEAETNTRLEGLRARRRMRYPAQKSTAEEADLFFQARQLLGIDEEEFQQEVAKLVARNEALSENPCLEIESPEANPLRTPEQLESWQGNEEGRSIKADAHERSQWLEGMEAAFRVGRRPRPEWT